MFKDDYKKAMSFPLREDLIQDTARLLEDPAPIRRQNRRVWVQSAALAAAACVLITLGVRYYGMGDVNLFAGAGSAAPTSDEAAAAPAGAANQMAGGPPAGDPPSQDAAADHRMEPAMTQEAPQSCENFDEDGTLLESGEVSFSLVSLEEIRELSSLGEALDWAELERVVGVSSEGEFPVEDGRYFLRVGGSDPEAPPECVLLCLPEAPEVSIDIRYESLDVFLAEHP